MRDLAWRTIGRLLFRASPHAFYRWRNFLLRLFGAQLTGAVKFRRSVDVDRPWNVAADHLAIFGDDAVLRARAPIRVGTRCVISQHAVLSTEARDHAADGYPVRAEPIVIEDDCWIATDTIVMPGATVRSGAVIGARALVEGEIPPWTVAAGEPAVPRRTRELQA